MNIYEPQGIQQQRGVFEIGEEARGLPSKHSQGEGREVKGEAGKRARTLASKAKYRAKKRAAEPQRILQRQNNWFPCSCCLAAIGLGSKMASRVIGMPHSTIQSLWCKRGVKPFKPPTGNWKSAPSDRSGETAMKADAKAKAQYESLWMEEINSHSRFPEWGVKSFEWTKVMMRRMRQGRYAKQNPEKRSEKHKAWRAGNPEKNKEINRISIERWKARDPIGFAQSRRDAGKKQRRDPKNKPRENMRKRFRQLMSNVKGCATSSFSSVVGCTRLQLKTHLEIRFKRGMTWENYGTYWHVDHVLPCASFNHHEPKQVRQCWHHSNLRPLEAIKNMTKGDSITEP